MPVSIISDSDGTGTLQMAAHRRNEFQKKQSNQACKLVIREVLHEVL
jgi:hypothetical protein